MGEAGKLVGVAVGPEQLVKTWAQRSNRPQKSDNVKVECRYEPGRKVGISLKLPWAWAPRLRLVSVESMEELDNHSDQWRTVTCFQWVASSCSTWPGVGRRQTSPFDTGRPPCPGLRSEAGWYSAASSRERTTMHTDRRLLHAPQGQTFAVDYTLALCSMRCATACPLPTFPAITRVRAGVWPATIERNTTRGSRRED